MRVLVWRQRCQQHRHPLHGLRPVRRDPGPGRQSGDRAGESAADFAPERRARFRPASSARPRGQRTSRALGPGQGRNPGEYRHADSAHHPRLLPAWDRTAVSIVFALGPGNRLSDLVRPGARQLWLGGAPRRSSSGKPDVSGRDVNQWRADVQRGRLHQAADYWHRSARSGAHGYQKLSGNWSAGADRAGGRLAYACAKQCESGVQRAGYHATAPRYRRPHDQHAFPEYRVREPAQAGCEDDQNRPCPASGWTWGSAASLLRGDRWIRYPQQPGCRNWPAGDLWTQMSQAMTAFYNCVDTELGLASKVTTFTMSDFSRTLKPNDTGDRVGTDH